MSARWMTAILVLLLLAPATGAEKAKEQTDWSIKKKLATGLHVSQIGYENWVAGGQDALTWVASLDGRMELRHKKMRYVLAASMEYGRIKQDDGPSKVSENRIRLESVLTYLKGTFVNPFVSVQFHSAIARSYDYAKKPAQPRADFLDPLVMQQSAGMGFEPVKAMKTRFGVALKETRTRNFPVYSDDPRTPEVERLKVETGIDHTTEFDRKFTENLRFYSKLELFSSFEHLDVVDVRWRNSLQAKITKLIAVNVKAHYLYDKDVSLKGQFMHSITVGLSYNFF